MRRTPPRPESQRLGRRIWRARSSYAFIAPFYILFAIFGLFPVIYSIYLAFYSWGGFGPRVSVGLGNFRTLLHDSAFWTALSNTAVLWLGHIFVLMAVSLGLALLVNKPGLRLKGTYRAVIFAPNMAAVAALSVVFSLIFTSKLGLLDLLLRHIGVSIDWLGSSTWSKPSIMILNIWDMAGFYMLIFLAGLQTIDAALYEAAKVDGASAWKRLLHVTLPGLRPVLLFAFILETIGSIQIFTEPNILTNGGPGLSSTSLGLYLYKTAFVYLKLGYASAMSVVLFLVTVVITLVLARLSRGVLGGGK